MSLRPIVWTAPLAFLFAFGCGDDTNGTGGGGSGASGSTSSTSSTSVTGSTSSVTGSTSASTGQSTSASTGSGGAVCGGIGGLPCGATEFCSYTLAELCGGDDSSGVCEPRPQGCTANVDPVCGCDFNTYSNECEANAAGVSITSLGECPQSGAACGGLGGDGIDCGVSEFCNYTLQANCGFADAPGQCTSIPSDCPEATDPVCGCDYVDYDNACEAHAHGAAVLAFGLCPDFRG